MAPVTRKVQLKHPEKKPKISNAERCRLYREAVKNDPVRSAAQKAKDLDRWKNYRERELTEEELAKKREQACIRSKRYRDSKKMKEGAAATKPRRKLTRTAHATQKDRAKQQKAKERKNWSSQKWRRHRESCRRYYQARKEQRLMLNQLEKQSATPDQPYPAHVSSSPAPMEMSAPLEPSPHMSAPLEPSPQISAPLEPSPPAESSNTMSAQDRKRKAARDRKVLSRAKKHLKNMSPGVIDKLVCFLTGSNKKKAAASPSPRKVKTMLKDRLSELKTQRSKKALAVRSLLGQFLSPKSQDPSAQHKKEADLYNRKRKNESTEAAVDFLEETATDLPGKKSVSKRTMRQKKVLPQRMKTLHKRFVETQMKKTSLRTMYRHLPKHIHTSRRQSYRQCLCEPCTNVDLKIDALNKVLRETSWGEIAGKDSLSELSLCREVTHDCLERSCQQCGVSKLHDQLLHEIQPLLGRVLQWGSWEMVSTKRGTRRELIQKESTAEELLKLLMLELQVFSKHLFVFRWQYHQFRQLKTQLPPTWAIAVFDFAENFLCKYQDEVQSAHWGYNQVTVHPCVLHYKCPQGCGEVVTDYLVFLSDDLVHDASFVKTVQEKTEEHLTQILGSHLEKLVIFSDGCSSQYKSKLPFFHLANSSGIQTERCFFGSRHGKNSCDACGGVVKRLVDDDILSGQVIIQSAKEMTRHCQSNHTMPAADGSVNECVHTRRSFHLLEPEEIDRSIKSSFVKTVQGTRKLHAIKKVGPNQLLLRNLACFCSPCQEGNATNCLNNVFVKPWKLVTLQVTAGLDKNHLPSEEQVASDEELVSDEEQAESEPTLPRDICFRRLMSEMSQCRNFAALEKVVSSSHTMTGLYGLPSQFPSTIPQVNGAVDATALSLKPPTAPPHYFPLQTVGDGNCFPRAVSRLIFGIENHHVEIRCRIVEELVRHREDYIRGVGMGDSDAERMNVVKTLAVLTEDCGKPLEALTVSDIDSAFRTEVLEVAKPSSFMGLWQFAAAANVIGREVVSLFPEKGWPLYQEINNRKLHPREKVCREPFFIMWTSTRHDEMDDRHWTSNHFVPLLPMTSEPTPEPQQQASSKSQKTHSVNSIYFTEWQGQLYVARVDEIDPTGFVLLNYMQQYDDGLYFWPSREETSWEPVSCVQAPVDLQFVPERSTNSRLCFSVSEADNTL